MPNLQNKTLVKMQGVPVENRHDDLLDFAQDKKPNNSSTASSRTSVMKRFYKKSKSATSINGKELEVQPKKSMFSGIFLQRKAPAPIMDGSLSFINNSGQSTSMEIPTPQDTPLQIVKSPNHKSSRSVAWNRLFHRLKSKPKDEAPQQNIIPEIETEEVQEENNPPPETQTERILAEPSIIANEEQQLAIDPEPERLKPKTPLKNPDLNEPEAYWKRWFYSLRGRPKDENPGQEATPGNKSEVPVKELQQVQNNPKTQSKNDIKESAMGASQKEQAPMDREPDRLKPKTPLKSNHRIQPQVYSKGWFHSFRGRSKDNVPEQQANARNETEMLLVKELQQVQKNPKTQSSKAPFGARQEQQLPIDPEPQRLEPENPINTDQRPNLIKSEVYKKRWFHSFRGQPKDETPTQKAISRNQTEEMQVKELQQVQKNLKTQSGNDFKEAPMGASPIDPEPEHLESQRLESQRLESQRSDPQRLEPKMPMKCDHYPGLPQVYSKRWFYSYKDETPEQKAIAEKETEEVKVKAVHQVKKNPETKSAKDSEVLPTIASQKQELPIDPEPQRLEPKMPMKRDNISVAGKSEETQPNPLVFHVAESKDANPNQPASDEINLPMDQESVRIKTQMLKSTSARNISEDVGPNQPALNVADSKNAVPNQLAYTIVTLPTDPESERLKTKIPKQGSSRNIAEEQICLFVAKEPEDLKPNKPAFDVAKQEVAVFKQTALDEINLPIDMEPLRLRSKTRQNISARNISENVEPNQPASTEVNMPIDPEAERLKTNIPKKRSARNVSENQTRAAEPEDAKPHQPAFDVAEQKVAVPKQTAPDEVNLPIYPEPEHLNPNTLTKGFSRKVSKEQIINPFKRQNLSVAPKPEDAEPHEPASDETNLNS